MSTKRVGGMVIDSESSDSEQVGAASSRPIKEAPSSPIGKTAELASPSASISKDNKKEEKELPTKRRRSSARSSRSSTPSAHHEDEESAASVAMKMEDESPVPSKRIKASSSSSASTSRKASISLVTKGKKKVQTIKEEDKHDEHDNDVSKEEGNEDEEEAEDYKPASKRKKNAVGKGIKQAPLKKEPSPLKGRKKAATVAAIKSESPVKKGKSAKAAAVASESNDKEDTGAYIKPEDAEAKAEEEEQEFKWWLEENQDGEVKWKTLTHKGPLFPPTYEAHGVRMKYDGNEIALDPESEEVASFFAALVGTDWAANPLFQKNFFADFLSVLARSKSPDAALIRHFEKCDFTPITDHFLRLKEQKKAMTKEEKAKIKEEKLAIDSVHGYALLDGRKEKVGNYRIEPPGLFRGRGEHPKTGSLKLRVQPEQVTINIGEDAEVPKPPEGHKWGSVIHDNTVTWLAMWKENVNDNTKYIFLAANSSLKGQSDLKKFEKARTLKGHVNRIRTDYTIELKDKLMATRQRATAMYLIDRLALRAGNEKGDDEADTVGCCSLRFEHITLEPPNKVIFDFLGKDSIRYYNEVTVDDQVFKNLKLFKREPKKEGDPLFDRLNTSLLNKHLSSYMEGLTAKVFRTYNASYTFQEELKKTPDDVTVAEKILAYNRANRQVAILCNHQRAVSKGHSDQMVKMQDKILGMKYELTLIADEMIILDPKLKKTRPELKEKDPDVTPEFIVRYKEQLKQKEMDRIEKLNIKRKEEGEEPLVYEEKKEKKASSLESLEKKYVGLSGRIQAHNTQLVDKDENKTTALGTSKINYIDPRISAAWCDKFDVPIEKIFSKSLREKFRWAMDADKDWVF